jgi:hypothetical protein
MADGKGCKCATYDESECACDADWTPQELIDARAEIACLRDALDEQTGRAEWNYECVTRCEEKVIQRDAEIDRLRLTDAEREAVERAAQWMVQLAKDRGEIQSAWYFVDDAATLRGLLERTK